MNKIHILHDHHNAKTTVVVGEFCINGCQTFHKSEAKMVFKKYGVSKEHQQEVIDRFEKYIPNEPFGLDCFKNLHERLNPLFGCDALLWAEIGNTLNLTDCGLYQNILTLLLTHYNTPELLDFLFNHKYKTLTVLGIKYYSTEQKDQLVLSNNAKFREELAILGEKKYLDILINDESEWVRCEVAKHGFKDHLDILVHDKSYEVRCVVAKHRHKDLLDILVHDEEDWVRCEVAKHGYKEHLDELVHDKFFVVRCEVAKHGHHEHLNILTNELEYLINCSKMMDEDY